MNWWNIFMTMLLLVILSLTVVNYINIQNNGIQSQNQAKISDSTLKQIMKHTDNLEAYSRQSIQEVSKNCENVFKDIFVH